MLPCDEIGKRELRAAELLVEPDTEVVQGGLSGQACLEAIEGMRTLAVEAEGMIQAPIDRLDDLAQARQPTPPGARPGVTAVALGGTNDDRSVVLSPMLIQGLPFEAFVGEIRPLSRSADTGQPWMGAVARGKEGLGQRRVRGSGRPEAQAGDDPHGVDGHQHMKALIPAKPVAPADVGEPRQPTVAPALGIASRRRGGVEQLKRTVLGVEPLDQVAQAGDERRRVMADQAVELGAVGQRGKGASPVALHLPIERPLARKGLPLAHQGKREPLTAGERGRWPGAVLGWQAGLVKVIHHDVQNREEGVDVDPRRSPFWLNWNLSLGHRHLPFSPQVTHTKR